MNFNRRQFFDSYRKAFEPLRQPQVDGLEFLLGKIEADKFSLPESAYLLATVKHETADTYQPIKEIRARKGTKLRAVQDRYWLSGFYGRGYAMITWENNYRKFGIASNPDKALEPEMAYEILARGMREGMFTKYKLSDFINANEVDYHGARRVVNGLDKAELIAGYAQKFERILKASLVTESVTEETKAAEQDKGATTGDKPAEETAGTPPPAPAVEVKASGVSLLTRLTSLSVPAGVVSAIGAIIAFAKELPPYAWVAFSAIMIAGMVIGFLIYRDSKAQAHERTKIVLAAAADRDKNNLRLI